MFFKRFITVVLGICLIAISVSAEEVKKENKKKTISVQNLDAVGVEAGITGVLSNLICDSTSKHKEYKVSCNQDIKAVLQHKMQMEVLQQKAGTEGLNLQLNSDFLLSGKVSKLGETYILSLSFTNTKTSEVIGRASKTVKGNVSKLIDVVDAAIKEVIGKK